jgi:hypothetical protein
MIEGEELKIVYYKEKNENCDGESKKEKWNNDVRYEEEYDSDGREKCVEESELKSLE